jgi:TPR repeat protein
VQGPATGSGSSRFPPFRPSPTGDPPSHRPQPPGSETTRDSSGTGRHAAARSSGRLEGRQLGRYTIERELARGGAGVVLLARDTQLGRAVAVKVLLKVDEKGAVRLAREARALAGLRHPNLVSVHDVGQWGERPYLVMDYVEGETLEARARREGPLPAAEVIRLGTALCDALGVLHGRQLLHRDIKPDNVLLALDGRPVLTDLGLVKVMAPDEQTRHLTHSGMLHGTPGYWSPEQAAGELSQLGPATDTYGLAATLFRCLTGEPPVEGRTLAEVLVNTLERDPLPPSRLVPGVPPGLDRALLRALAKAPEDRYASAAEFADALQRGEGAPARRLPAPVLVACALGGLVAAVALFAVLPTAPPDDPASSPAAPATAPAGSPPETPAGEPEPEPEPTLLEEAREVERTRGARASVELYRAAARADDLDAMVRLGQMLSVYDEVQDDDEEAAAWFRRAAEAGHPRGMSEIGFMLLLGRGVPKDEAAAAEWFARSAAAGDPEGMSNLGYAYHYGHGVERDWGRALDWYQRAADAGHPAALRNLGIMYLDGDEVPQDEVRGAEYLRRAAELGELGAMAWLGTCYSNGRGVTRDPARALHWYLTAGDAGNETSLYNAAALLLQDPDLPRDPVQARTLLTRSAERGYPKARLLLGQLLETGQGGPADPVRARESFRQAGQDGEPEAMLQYSRCLNFGVGGPVDQVEALAWLERSAETGHPRAMFELAYAHETEQYGLPRNLTEARLWYQRALDAGMVHARARLRDLGQ